jgi:exonuclease III
MNTLRTMAWNTNGKWTDFHTPIHICALFKQLELDVLCFSEPRIITSDIVNIKRSCGDKPLFISCENTRVHGTGILLHERYNGCVLRWEASKIAGRAVMGLVRTHSCLTMIISVYLPACPLEAESESISQQVEIDIANWISLATDQYYDLIVAGDFNVNLLELTKARASRLSAIFQNLHICFNGTKPTHNRNGALDNIVISILGIQNLTVNIETRLLPIASDHCPLVVQYSINDKIVGDTIAYYEYENADLDKVNQYAKHKIQTKYMHEDPSPSIQEIHEYLIQDTKKFLKPAGKKGFHCSKAWKNQNVKDLYRRITVLEQSRLKLKGQINISTIGRLSNIIREECKITSVKFSNASSLSLRVSVASTACILRKQAIKEIQRMQMEQEKAFETEGINSARKNWAMTKQCTKTALINRLKIHDHLSSDPEAILNYVTNEFEKRYSLPSVQDPAIPEKIKKLLEQTSFDWNQETTSEFLKEITIWDIKVVANNRADTAGLNGIMADLIRNLDPDMLK